MEPAATTPATTTTGDLSIFQQWRVPLRNLAGYRKSWQVPDEEAARNRLAIQWSRRDLDRRVDEVFARLRDPLGFRRQQIEVIGPADGCCVLTVPDFDVELGIRAVPPSPECLWHCSISGFRKPEWLNGNRLQPVFPGPVSGLQIGLDDLWSLGQIIDHTESCRPEGLLVSYDRTASWCELAWQDIPLRVRLEEGRVTAMAEQKPGSPGELVAWWTGFRNRLADRLPPLAS